MIEAWLFTGEKLFKAYQDGKVEVLILPLTEAMLQDLPETIALFDYKALLKKFPQLADIPQEKIFDVKLAGYAADSADNFDTAKKCIAKFFPDTDVETPEAEAELLLKTAGKVLELLPDDSLYRDIELPLAQVLNSMENNGIAVDAAALKDFGSSLAVELEETQQKVFELAGRSFNINSPKQLAEVLFEELKLPAAGKKTKSGSSTDAETLEKLSPLHPVIEQILKYRKLAKVKSTYVDGLLKYIQSDGKVHTSFNMTATATGRLSSVEPNMQNIPVAGEVGGEIRRFIHPACNWTFIDADYSQIELRILAHMADDPVMIAAFKNNQDIHTTTASQIFNVAPAQVTGEMRRKAKAVNFGIVYGISAFTLANDLNIPKAEAQEYINKYFEKYSAVKKYLDDSIKTARAKGYAETLFGRKRFLSELKSKNFAIRSFGERVALNMPIQGTAADLMKMAMIKVYRALQQFCPEAEMLLQVHDELLIAVPDSSVDKAAKILQDAMQNVTQLSVPLDVSIASGKTYFDVK